MRPCVRIISQTGKQIWTIRSPLHARRPETGRACVVVRAAGILLASDGQISDIDFRETALLVADAIQGAAVVALYTACKASPFEQLESSVGSIIDAVPADDEADNYQGYHVNGTTADAISIATDPKQGLCSAIGLDPVLCIILGKGSAVGPDADRSAAVALARRCAVAGVPTVTCCLATTKRDAQWNPVLDALWSLLPAVKFSLEATNGFPAAANFPRAHYPFPERGRCSLGIEVPLHPSVSRAARSGGASWALKDCWSLGEEVPPGRRPPSLLEPVAAQDLLRAAFADADAFVTATVPPHLPHGTDQPLFAATRSGVIWHRDEVERASQAAPADTREDLARRRATDRDLWGRSLPSQSLASPTSSTLAVGSFVSQDQTASVTQRAQRSREGSYMRDSAGGAGGPRGGETMSFAVGRGRALSDPVLAGDVDALFGGRVAVSVSQTWPAGHPCSLTDATLAAGIAEDEETGLPLWLLP